MSYSPPKEVLEKYAHVLVNFALGEGKGIEKGDVVLVKTNERVQEFIPYLFEQIIKAGGHPIMDLQLTTIDDVFYEVADEKQLSYSPTAIMQSYINTADHVIIMKSPAPNIDDPDPKRVDLYGGRKGDYVRYRRQKFEKKQLTYTIAYYPNEYLAELAECTLEAYWLEIIKAVYLNLPDPVAKWKQTFKEMHETRDKLDELDIVSLHVKSNQTDFVVGLGEKRRWVAGSGRNMPSFEIYTSPDWRTVNGIYTATEPVMIRGEIVKVIKLRFEDGIVVEAKAQVGDEALQNLLEEKRANRIGEFSLTDKRHSAITRYLAATLFDENRGGAYGNTHIALGRAPLVAYSGNRKRETIELGFNDSPVHVDIVSTEDRTVTATLRNGDKKVIYKDGMFTL